MKRPIKWKMALLSWVCIYPLINLIFFTVMPHIEPWHPLLKTLLTTLLLVPLMGVMQSALQRWVGEWLYQ